ncbi:MAG: hypothetical protein GC203_01710 [Phenylobacterium sp.]|uniref:hypothetical protein n=1 Tax=Phenylobacterium sp. TaxID=1871053 RepID=UPI0025E6D076|nr:hypothetical protein [Phenylobacterium sp.]MBI1196561.1 hypothetical protein [Phenylobacterium sp.]
MSKQRQLRGVMIAGVAVVVASGAGLGPTAFAATTQPVTADFPAYSGGYCAKQTANTAQVCQKMEANSKEELKKDWPKLDGEKRISCKTLGIQAGESYSVTLMCVRPQVE